MKNRLFNLSKMTYVLMLVVGITNISYAQTAQTTQALAPQNTPPSIYNGKTLDKIKSTGKIVIGVRTSAIPLSYTENSKEDKMPMGYAVDICNLIADQYKVQNKLTGIQTQYVFVNTKNRISKVNSGDVDMECGITTNTAERRQQVHFSIPYYISSDRILTLNTRKDITNLDSLMDKSIGFIKDSTMDKTLNRYNDIRGMKINKIEFDSPEAAFEGLSNKKIDAFLYNDSIVYGLKANSSNPSDYKILSENLDVEASSIMMRANDKEFSSFVDNALKDLMKSGQVQNLYNKWFLSPIAPKNKTLGLEQKKALKDVLRYPTTIVGN